MQIRKSLVGLGIALCMVACSKTSLPKPRDGAADGQPTPDGRTHTDIVRSSPDSATPAPDGLDRDGAAPRLLDTASSEVLARDATADVAALLARDATSGDVKTTETAADTRDVAGREAVGLADGRETSAHPFAGRTFRIDDTKPAPTPDPDCTPRAMSAATLTFSADVTTLTGVASSGSTAFKFSATAGPEADKLTYHVTNITGGEVFFERDQGVYVAQVVLFGSGVPVMWCLRGALDPQP